MRRVALPSAVLAVGILAAGCAGSAESFRSEVSVASAEGETGCWRVEFKLDRVGREGRAERIAAPTLVVEPGREGTITLGDGRDGYAWRVLVREPEGGVEASATAEVLRGGAVVWKSDQVLRLDPARP